MYKIACRRAAGVAGLTLVLAACGSSSPSSSTSAASASGAVTFRASSSSLAVINSKSDIVPVTASGLIADTGTIPLSGTGTTSTIKLGAGDVKVSHAKGKTHQGVSKACAVTFVDSGTYTITGGTGKYAGATGHGTDSITFTGRVPKKSNGSCNMNSNKVTNAHETFVAHGPMALKK